MGVFWEGLKGAVGLLLSGDREIYSIILLSLFVSGTATVLGGILGVPAGLYLGARDTRMSRALTRLAYTLMGLPPVVAGLIIFLLYSHAGPLGNWGLLFTPAAMITAQVVLVIPIVTSYTRNAVFAAHRDYIELLRSLSAGRFRTGLMLLFQARSAIAAGFMAGLGRALAEVGAVQIVGGDIRYHTRVLTTAVVLETRQGNFSRAIALGLILLLLSFILNSLLYSWQRGREL
jgi:tungstate transport system permease protein